MALNQSLRRSDSTGLSNVSGSVGRFGSIVSGFWSVRRESSTDESDAFASSQEACLDPRARQESTKSSGKLDKMIEEVQTYSQSDNYDQVTANQSRRRSVRIPHAPDQTPDQPLEGALDARSVSDVPKPKKIPLKIALNEQNGTVDVEMPLANSFASSLASSFASCHLYKSAPDLLHHFTPYGRPVTPESPRMSSSPAIEVAGWLKKYHQDFTLQAVRPYEGLEDEVRKSLQMDAQISSMDKNDFSQLPADGSWTDVSTALIADTTVFSIRRLRLRQRRKALSSFSSQSTEILNKSSVETNITSELLTDLDPILIDAVERILAQSGRSSRTHSRAPSPVRSENRSENRPGSIAEDCGRTVLGALEEIVRLVQGEVEDGERERGRRRKDGGRDSTLREGVRRWLAGEDGKDRK